VVDPRASLGSIKLEKRGGRVHTHRFRIEPFDLKPAQQSILNKEMSECVKEIVLIVR